VSYFKLVSKYEMNYIKFINFNLKGECLTKRYQSTKEHTETSILTSILRSYQINELVTANCTLCHRASASYLKRCG